MKRYTIRSTRSAMLLLLGSLFPPVCLDKTSLRLATPSASTCMWMDRNRWPQGAGVATESAITPKRQGQGIHSGIPSWRRVGQSTIMSMRSIYEVLPHYAVR
jgi:hypothetical protein